MKKALSVFLMLALVGSVFAAEPVADVNVAEFSGNASVQWGVDLDSGKTGFKNDYQVDLKLNLLNGGSKSTTGDGIWGELVIKTDSDSFLQWENGGDYLMVGDAAFPSNAGMTSNLNLNVYVDTAKLHFGPVYVGITRGNTQTGELKMDAAIRSSDDDQAKWLSDVGPDKYSQGIVAGFEHDLFNVAVDFRSYAENRADFAKVTVKTTDGKHTLLETYVMYGSGTGYASIEAVKAEYETKYGKGASVTVEDVSTHNIKDQYTNKYAMATEVEVTPIDNLSIKAGVSSDFSSEVGYSTSVGYKFGINDTFYIRPQVGFTGLTEIGSSKVGSGKTTTSTTSMSMAAGLLFGWGDIGIDANADVPFLDGDSAKKVSPGVGVVMSVPLPTIATSNWKDGSNYTKGSMTTTGNLATRIMPSFYSGEIVPGLTAALYADIGITQDSKTRVKGESEIDGIKVSADETTVGVKAPDTPFAVAFGAKYAIPVGAITITPNAGIRYANNAYHTLSASKGIVEEKDDGVFADMGDQTAVDGDYMNLKAGVDVTGLVSNTTFSVIYDSSNLLNADETDGAKKAGTLNFKVKISL